MSLVDPFNEVCFSLANLIEFGTPVKCRGIPVLRDLFSGYLGYPAPEKSWLENYYKTAYHLDDSKGYNGNAHFTNSRLLQERAEIIINLARRFLGNTPRAALELGCAFGAQVSEFKSRNIKVTGFDLNSSAVEFGNSQLGKESLYYGDILSAIEFLDTNDIDLIYSFHVLEHFIDLFDFFRVLGRKMKNQLFFATVPNAMYLPSLLKGFVGHFWAGYPDHLHLLSQGTLLYLCKLGGFYPLWISSSNAKLLDPRPFQRISELQSQYGNEVLDHLTSCSGFGAEISFLLVKQTSNDIVRTNQNIISLNLERLRKQCVIELQIRNSFSSRPTYHS